jgi:dihydrolipoamide dehydrogenase
LRVSQLGGKATLIENDALGGTCINRGCIPVRTLLRVAEMVDLTRYAKDYGVNYKETEIDLSKMISRKNIIIRTLLTGLKQSFSSNGVEVIEGIGRLLSPSKIEVQLKDGGKKEITARKIIIATGAEWKKPSIPGVEKIITPNEVLELKVVPKSMIIIGGGFIGTSIATIYSKLGTQITLLEESPKILHELDREIVSIFEKELENSKIKTYTEAHVDKVEDKGPEEKNVGVAVKGKEIKLETQHLVVAEERESNLKGIDLNKVGIKLNDKQGIAVNRRMETNVPTILAAGDVTMEQMWTHVAYVEGMVAAENAMGRGSEVDYKAIPYGTNTFPEISGVGLTEEEAMVQGRQVKVEKYPFAGNSLATILGQRIGMVKIITDTKYGQILGVHMIGPRANELIGEAAVAMKLEMTLEDLSSVLHLHPTLSEVFWEMARGTIL